MKDSFLITCEHASHTMPDEYQGRVSDWLLNSHRGYDRGSEILFEYLIKCIPCFHMKGKYSRLLIDLNRSLNSPQLFSNNMLYRNEKTKDDLIKQIYQPYQSEIVNFIENKIAQQQRVIHLSIHSFTPVLRGEKRTTDIGLLFDETRIDEFNYCLNVKDKLQTKINHRIEFNSPYAGADDGQTTIMRQKFSESHYIGIEIELNQRLFRLTPSSQLKLFKALGSSLLQ